MFLRLSLMAAIAVALTCSALAQNIDLQRGLRNYNLYLKGERTIDSFTPQELREVFAVHDLLKGDAGDEDDRPRFEVTYAIRGCKYFVAEQGANYSLVEDWLCSRPSKGDVGYGDIDGYGFKEVKLNGSSCTVYVDDWLLSKSRATEKLLDKCD